MRNGGEGRARLLLVILIVTSLFLITLDLRGVKVIEGFKQGTQTVLSPFQRAGATVFSPVKDFFSDVDILDVTISAFIVGAVLYSVHYYKFMMMIEKTGYADLNGRIQKVETTMAKKAAAEANAAGGGRKQRRPVMRIS